MYHTVTVRSYTCTYKPVSESVLPSFPHKPLTLQPVFDLSKKAMAEAMSFLEGAGGVHGGGARAATTAQEAE